MNIQRWQYVTLPRDGWDSLDGLIKVMDELGYDGWELITATEKVFVFKRPVEE